MEYGAQKDAIGYRELRGLQKGVGDSSSCVEMSGLRLPLVAALNSIHCLGAGCSG